MTDRKSAYLVLDDGRIFEGQAWAAEGETFGEAVFSTGMTGYQETLTDPRVNQVPFEVLESDSKECIFQEGVPGFTIDVWRILKRDGVEFKREKYRTRYRAEDRIICTNPEARWMNPPLSVQRSLGS